MSPPLLAFFFLHFSFFSFCAIFLLILIVVFDRLVYLDLMNIFFWSLKGFIKERISYWNPRSLALVTLFSYLTLFLPILFMVWPYESFLFLWYRRESKKREEHLSIFTPVAPISRGKYLSAFPVAFSYQYSFFLLWCRKEGKGRKFRDLYSFCLSHPFKCSADLLCCILILRRCPFVAVNWRQRRKDSFGIYVLLVRLLFMEYDTLKCFIF